MWQTQAKPWGSAPNPKFQTGPYGLPRSRLKCFRRPFLVSGGDDNDLLRRSFPRARAVREKSNPDSARDPRAIKFGIATPLRVNLPTESQRRGMSKLKKNQPAMVTLPQPALEGSWPAWSSTQKKIKITIPSLLPLSPRKNQRHRVRKLARVRLSS